MLKVPPLGRAIKPQPPKGGTLNVCLASFVFLIFAASSLFAQPAKTPIRFSDIPADFHAWLKEQGITAATFDAYRDKINQQTAERETRGEWEHLIYYALQGTRFTKLPKVEPALSARAFAQKLKPDEQAQWLSTQKPFTPTTSQLPAEVTARLAAFQQALQAATNDERLLYFQQFTRARQMSATDLRTALQREYAAAMRFLYQKEFQAGKATAAEVAALYQTRGHSTDTQVEANYAVQTMLAVLKSGQPELKINRVLIVGPGLDFAPRTDLLDVFEPQSYQPFAIADALLRLKLTDESQLRIDCADINPRVINYLQRVSQRGPVQLALLTGIADRPGTALTEDFKNYFATLGQGIGLATPLKLPPAFAGHLSKSLSVRPAIAQTIHPISLNVVTEKVENASPYDLIVVTNVFPYFDDIELLLTLTNLYGALGKTGFLMHNESRVVSPNVTQQLKLPVLHSRTVLIAEGQTTPLYDFIAVHQKPKKQ